MFWENWQVFKWTNDANSWFLFPRRWNLWYTESNIFSTITYFRLFESNWNAVNIMYLCWANVTIHIHHNATCTPWGWLHNENFWDMILPFAIDWHLKVLYSLSVIVTRLCWLTLRKMFEVFRCLREATVFALYKRLCISYYLPVGTATVTHQTCVENYLYSIQKWSGNQISCERVRTGV